MTEGAQYTWTVEGGLGRAPRPQRVVVVGAGMAGLMAACEIYAS